MAMLRPGILALWRRWRRAAWPFLPAGLLTAYGWPWLSRGDWPSLAAIATVLALTAGFVLIEIRRARLSRPPTGPGMVTVAERRIGYWGPEGGGFVALADLTRIELDVDPGANPDSMDSDIVWRLVTPGHSLEIPAHAAGAERLYDAFAPLPGIDWDAVAGAMADVYTARYTVWEKQR